MAINGRLESWLARGTPILADGAMGTMLYSRAGRYVPCFDELNLTQPEIVAEIHREYIEAGAEIIETNTFGANRYKLAVQNLEDEMAEINDAAVAIARGVIKETGRDVLLAGSVGPLGVRLMPFGRVTPKQAYSAYCEQIAALNDAGVELIWIETQNDLFEVRESVRAARAVSQLPVIVTMTFTRDDRTLLGDSPAQVALDLAKAGADVIGANCSAGPAQLLRVIRQMREAVPDRPLAVKPNGGWPEQVGGRIMYPATTEYFGEYALAFREAGAAIIGGCCGTTPDHIAAMRQALEKPLSDQGLPPPMVIAEGRVEAVASIDQPTQLSRRLAEGKFVITVEMDPPRGFSTHKLIAGALLLAESGADFIDVADSPMARMRMSPWAACQLIQERVGIETVLHFPTRGRNLLRIQGDLLAAHALGVRNIFVVMGDPTAIGDYPDALDDYDVVPSGLIKLIEQRFNAGVDYAGADIGGTTSFFVGAALNLNAINRGRELRVMRKKVEAGADFFLTQPIYNREVVESFLSEYRNRYGLLEIPVLIGAMPLYGRRHVAYLHNEVPGVRIPTSIQERIADAGSNAPAEGVKIAIEVLKSLRSEVQGAYIMPPFGRYDLAAEIIEAMRN